MAKPPKTGGEAPQRIARANRRRPGGLADIAAGMAQPQPAPGRHEPAAAAPTGADPLFWSARAAEATAAPRKVAACLSKRLGIAQRLVFALNFGCSQRSGTGEALLATQPTARPGTFAVASSEPLTGLNAELDKHGMEEVPSPDHPPGAGLDAWQDAHRRARRGGFTVVASCDGYSDSANPYGCARVVCRHKRCRAGGHDAAVIASASSARVWLITSRFGAFAHRRCAHQRPALATVQARAGGRSADRTPLNTANSYAAADSVGQ